MKDSKKNHSKKIDKLAYKRFFSYLLKYRKSILISIVVVPISVFSSIGIPILTIRIVDDHFATGNTENVFYLIYVYIALFVCSYLANTCYSFFLQRAGNLVLNDVSNDLFDHVLKLPQAYFDRVSNGITLARLTTDFETIRETLVMGVINLFVDLLNVIVLCIFLFIISAKLSIVFVMLVPVILIVTQLLRLKLRKYYELSRQSLATSISYLSECLQGMKTVLLLRAEDSTAKKYKKQNHLFYKYKSKENLYEASLFSIVEGISILTVALVLLFGSRYTLTGALTIGTLIAFYQTLQKIFFPIREFTQQFSTIQRAAASMHSIEKLFLEPNDVLIKPTGITPKFESLEFQSVSFRYGEDQPLAIKNVSFKLGVGQRIAFVGRTGSGKSTILKLLTKKYHHYQGKILVNGIDLRDYSSADLLKMFSIMSQDVYLFNDSIGFNVSLDKNNIDSERIRNSIEKIKADRFIYDLPGQLKHHVQEGGKNLSIGEMQVLGLARSYFKNGDLFILDEATASIDSITEDYIEKTLQKIFSEKTVIAIAHRLSTIQGSDMIYVMSKGKIIEQGNHRQLFDLKAEYYKMATSSKDNILLDDKPEEVVEHDYN